ncbi:NlpC/P60 family protein [Bacillaceae bacterium W0354]
MVNYKKTRSFFLGTMAGSLALSSPFAFHLPVDAESKQQYMELHQLKYGDHHQAVVHLQSKLKTLNYYHAEIVPNYNVLTEHAIKSFQIAQNLPDSGVADEETVLSLEQEIEKHHIKIIKENADKITNGEQTKRVRDIQEALDYFGLYEGEIDGIAGPLTKKGLERMNSIKNLAINLDGYNTIASTATTNNTNNNTQQNTSQRKIVHTNYSKSSGEARHGSVIQTARSYMGTPYVWGGESPSGFDCSGFIQYVFYEHGISLPRTVSDIWNVTSPVNQPSVGDLVFFETYKPGPSHLGIYLGDGNFIHAGLNNGVTISHLSETYWNVRYLGARRVGN